MPDNAFFFKNHNIHFFQEIESTNSYAYDRLRSGNAIHGEVIRAAYQSSGRGMPGNVWHSGKDKNVLFSVICKDLNVPAEKLSLFNMSVSLAIREVLKLYLSEEVTVKWPNDIYVSDKKIAGVLIETVLTCHLIKHMILGAGINVNEDSFPDTLNSACSIYTVKGKKLQTEEVFLLTLNELNKKMAFIGGEEESKILKEYNEALYQSNIKRYFRSREGRFEGSIVKVNEKGQLLIERNDIITAFNHKEVSFD
ncbi:MAG: biotin--[acetyl-CoA-carboxylase] ligase [Flavobacteriales bacterium]|nr:biotin--[acetyl-CoA-carboxylase] ligase [Flavobacteriales bacterium]